MWTEGTTMDIGTLYEGQTTVRNLAIVNKGNAMLHIKRVWTSCGCTAAKLSSSNIPPSQRETLSVSFDTKDLQGKFKRVVHITSDDTLNPQLDITCKGIIVPVVLVSPRYISFGQSKLHYGQRKTVQIKNTIIDTIRVLSYSSPEPQIHLSLDTPVIPPNGVAELDVEMTPTHKGKLLGQIKMVTDNRMKPVIKISYIGTIK